MNQRRQAREPGCPGSICRKDTPMTRFDAAFWRLVFRAKGVWNCGASLAFLVFENTIRDWLRVPHPDSLYRALFLALASVFGLGYWWVGRDLEKNHDIVRMG